MGAQEDDVPRGPVRVSASSIFSEYCLTDMLTSFRRVNLAVAVDLQISEWMTKLAEEGIDLVIRVARR